MESACEIRKERNIRLGNENIEILLNLFVIARSDPTRKTSF